MAGFWKYAQEDPDYLAIVDPDGTEHTRRRRARARATRSCTRCARSGCSRATRSPRCCRTASHPCTCTSPRCRPACTTCRSTTGCRRPEIAYILTGLRREGVRQPRALRRPRERGGRRGRASRPSAASRTARSPGFRSFDEVVDRAADDAARRPRDRRGDALHVGHHRQAEGREAPAHRASTPTRQRRAVHVPARPVRHHAAATATCTCRRRRTTTPRSPRSRATRCT